MHSTRKPPFCPPPLPGEEDAGSLTNVVQLWQDRRNAQISPIQDSDEPPWRQAFVLAEGVKATRTPDKVIRARNGYAEPSVTEPERLAAATGPITSSQPHSAVGKEAVRTPEPAIRSQLAELQSALTCEDAVSERLASLADREAALAGEDAHGTAAAVSPRLMLEKATRLPSLRKPSAVEAVPTQEQPPVLGAEPATASFTLPPAAVSFSWQGSAYWMAGIRSAGGPAAAEPLDPADGQTLEDISLVTETTEEGETDSTDAVQAENAARIEPAPSSGPAPHAKIPAEIAAVIDEEAFPADSVTSVSHAVKQAMDLGYLALYEDLLPARSTKPPTENEPQPQPERMVELAQGFMPEQAVIPVRDSIHVTPAPDTATGERSAVSLWTEPLQEVGPIVDLPQVDAATWGHPVARPADLDNWSYRKPDIGFLAEPPERDGPELTEDILEETAGRLEKVIRDFGVKGEVIHVHPGPVVTLYEFEPAPGIKSSRVIALADDIARSMSAVSARVAVIPGRNAIGIELPNEVRETVYLRELLASEDFDVSKHKLPLCLGKTIGGEPVIADLARMPHLLVAGTTGSGKSVAINTMILSLLYRFTPEQCRLIMVDPKMLELSVYDGIPHLLTPVVTDPKKAIIALRWAVREMEDRYRKMSKLGVRNIDGFNARVSEAKARGEIITRTVQTGFDKATGELAYVEEVMDLEPLPYIVVIVDEMADLMMVAGKDIEGAIQRLAQMARAAGIHVVLATQRPSVDVITGTIKANFPTRISFQVTSKIDSRTILGEMGAEQLLGQGDMLYMAGGGRITRVHGPFCSDEEVEKVVAHLKRQGRPQYLEAVTAEEDEGGGATGDAPVFDAGEFGASGGDLYDQAVAVVLRDKKASTSYIQRRLQIGYNRAASLMERMEKEGIVGPANHAGKRDILLENHAMDED
jgi:DNA segregation ATPase FtsK/SpoIIIE, S-DNA-T family